jgi:hypothetical protein
MSITRIYLGNPVGPFGMQPIPAINIGGSLGSGGMTPTLTRATVTQTLVSGGATVMRKPRTKQSYSVGWRIRGAADMDLLTSFFTGVQGGGPYCLVDPSWSNYLPPNVASMGAVLGALPEWSPTAGTLASTTATAPPTGKMSGVGAWASAGSGSVLYAGLNNVVDGTWLPPILAGLSCRFSIWARTLTGTATVTPAVMYGIGGTAPAGTAATGSAGSLTTTWQQLTVPVAAGFSWPSTSDWIMPNLTCSTAAAPNILLAAAEFVYDTAAAASVLNPWVSGFGVPRVVITGDAGSPVGRPGLRDYTMTMRET